MTPVLLDFQCDNFKSFEDGFDFFMEPVSRLTELRHSILKETAGKKIVQGLSASVIYGPNAAGKTSVVNAMSCMRQIVLRGTVRNTEEDLSGDHVSHDLSLAPFAFGKKTRPVKFDIVFTFDGIKYRYILSVSLGSFLERNHARYIESEQLYVNDEVVFAREKEEVTKLSLRGIGGSLNAGCNVEETDKIRRAMSGNIVHESLLLTTDFNSFCSKKIVSNIIAWFDRQFIVVNSADRIRFFPLIPQNSGAFADERVNEIAQEAGIIGSDFAYISDEKTTTPRLVSVLKKTEQGFYGVDSERIESLGTLRLISLMPVMLLAMARGAVLVIDELDASLHPMIVMNLLSVFHNDSANRKGAQLIFNTHNPIYLNRRLLRRDEIKFVERDKDTKSSILYALSDFRANGEVSVRKTSDYMKNYFVNRYGAIEDVDFTDIFMRLFDKEESHE